MKILRKGFQGIAVIDPSKAYGEDGQYESYPGNHLDLETVITKARSINHEIRYYYKNLIAGDGEPIASQVIVTEIPPLHVQPFHTHEQLHEMTIVNEGLIAAIDHETMTEEEARQLMLHRVNITPLLEVLGVGDMVVEDPGIRHTIMNPVDRAYAKIVTVQTARIPLEEFPHDWIRG